MDMLLTHKEGLLYALLGFIVFGWLLAKAPMLIINWLIAMVDAMYAAGDAADDRLLTAFMRWINEKFGPKAEGDTTWPERMNAAALRLIAWLPFLPVRLFFQAHADKIRELCLKLYELGIAAAKRQAEEHAEPPAAPPEVRPEPPASPAEPPQA